jgi:hypothetical protein
MLDIVGELSLTNWNGNLPAHFASPAPALTFHETVLIQTS